MLKTTGIPLFSTTYSPSPSVYPPLDPNFNTSVKHHRHTKHHVTKTHHRSRSYHTQYRSIPIKKRTVILSFSGINCDCTTGFNCTLQLAKHGNRIPPKSLPLKYYFQRWNTFTNQKLSHCPIVHFKRHNKLASRRLHIYCCTRYQRGLLICYLRHFLQNMNKQFHEHWKYHLCRHNFISPKHLPSPTPPLKACCVTNLTLNQINIQIFPILRCASINIKFADIKLYQNTATTTYCLYLLCNHPHHFHKLLQCLITAVKLDPNIKFVNNTDEVSKITTN